MFESVYSKKNETTFTRSIMDWINGGGLSLSLTFLLMCVSIYHYTIVLQLMDPPAIAFAIAILVDIGQFQFILFLLRKRFTRQEITPAIVSIVLALISSGYCIVFHFRYYAGDLFLSCLVPFSTVFLAWITYWQRKEWEKGEPDAGDDKIRCDKCRQRINPENYQAHRKACRGNKMKKKRET